MFFEVVSNEAFKQKSHSTSLSLHSEVLLCRLLEEVEEKVPAIDEGKEGMEG